MTSPTRSALPEITDADFVLFRDHFYKRTGIWFGPERRYFVDKRLQARIADCHEPDFRRWFTRMRFDLQGSEFQALVNAMTVNETYFDREEHQYECLIQSVLPELSRHRRKDDPIRIWSLPCSTGEEPYSIVIRLSEHWADLANYDVEITASDIDTRVLQSARAGTYGRRSIEKLPQKVLRRYFDPVDQVFQLKREWRECVRFTVANLTDAELPATMPPQDVIFCRNVLIYFDQASRERAAAVLHQSLRPGGFLFLGHSESMSRISSAFALRRFDDAIVYQKAKG